MSAAQNFSDNDEEQDDFPMHAGADLPFEQIPFMSKKQRETLQQDFPNLPPYIFMTDK